jgi:hypothetical protein
MLTVEIYSKVVDQLFKFTTSDQIDEMVRQKVEETIESIPHVQRLFQQEVTYQVIELILYLNRQFRRY